MQNIDVKVEKTQLRKAIMAVRDRMEPIDRLGLSNRICDLVMATSRYTRSKDILVYKSYGSEVITDRLIEKSLELHKNVYCPKVEGENMEFYKINSLSDLQPGYKGIMEPFFLNGPYSGSREVSVVIPGTVFGRDGYRIGYGKGFYDKYLSRYNNLYKIGICFSCQVVDSIPREEFDVRLDEIICESFILTKDGKGEARWI